MKNVRFILAVTILFAMSSNNVIAQDTNKKVEMLEQLKEAKDKLSLTVDQEPKFLEISKRYHLKMKELKDSNLEKKEKFKAIKEMQSQKKEEMKALLSDEQFKVYIQMQEERKTKMKERRK